LLNIFDHGLLSSSRPRPLHPRTNIIMAGLHLIAGWKSRLRSSTRASPQRNYPSHPITSRITLGMDSRRRDRRMRLILDRLQPRPPQTPAHLHHPRGHARTSSEHIQRVLRPCSCLATSRKHSHEAETIKRVFELRHTGYPGAVVQTVVHLQYPIVHSLIDASLAVTSDVSCFFLSSIHIHLPVPCSHDRYR
jgi:hypothetical protein